MRAQPFALALLLLGGAGVGFLIGGLPDVAPELETTVEAEATSSSSTSSSPASSTTAPSPTTAPAATGGLHAPEEVAVVVLNGAGMNGAAGEVTNALAGLGYLTQPPGNTDRRDATIVLFADGYEADAAAIARAINPAVTTGPLGGEPIAAPEGASVVVVLGNDYGSFAGG